MTSEVGYDLIGLWRLRDCVDAWRKAIHYPIHERVETVRMPGEKQFTTRFMKERVETVWMPGEKQFTTQFMKESRLWGCLEKSNSLPGSWKSRDCEDAWRKAVHYPVHERVETVRMPGEKQFTTQFMKESRLWGCLEKSNSLPGSWKSRDCEDAWRKAIHYPVHERVETVRMPGEKQFTTQFMKESRLWGCLEKSNSLPGSWKSRDCVDAWRKAIHYPVHGRVETVWMPGEKQFTTRFMEESRLCGCLEKSNSLPSSWKSRDCEDAWRKAIHYPVHERVETVRMSGEKQFTTQFMEESRLWGCLEKSNSLPKSWKSRDCVDAWRKAIHYPVHERVETVRMSGEKQFTTQFMEESRLWGCLEKSNSLPKSWKSRDCVDAWRKAIHYPVHERVETVYMPGGKQFTTQFIKESRLSIRRAKRRWYQDYEPSNCLCLLCHGYSTLFR